MHERLMRKSREEASPTLRVQPTRLLGAPGPQARLTLGPERDEYELEAERIADQLTREPRPFSSQPEADAAERTGGSVPAGSSEWEPHVAGLRGGGHPLPEPIRGEFEPRFGHDFSRVRIHTDESAARSLRSEAFTVGHDIVFRAGRYQPDTPEGQHLLAHELTHVVQQRAAGPLGSRETQGVGSAPGVFVQRKTTETKPAAAPAAAAPAAATPAACALTTYTGSNFQGAKVVADTEFTDSLDSINTHAGTHGVKVHVTGSFRRAGAVVRGAIVPPAKHSNHLAGHAIDMNVVVGGTFYTARKLKKKELTKQPKAVQDFIQAIRDDAGLRWGGDFRPEDPVHIDDHLNADASAWAARYKATQQARKDKCG